MSDFLHTLEVAGVLDALDVELARTLGRLSGERSRDVLLAVALAQRALREGHACLELERVAGSELLDEAGDVVLRCPEKDAWRAAIAASPLLRANPPWDLVPLVFEGDTRLYLARVHDHECALAARLRALAQRTLPVPLPDDTLVDSLFPPLTDGEPDLQRAAALGARTRAFSVIVGGPGTGKTSTVVKLLALLIEDAFTGGRPAPRIALLAPTGKAAQRLSESIGKARSNLPVSERVRAAIPAEARTIHRALGSRPDSVPRFRHGPDLPLPCDVVLVDEASMIDLALMRHLLAAVPGHARVILLGDADQLASVEVGSVLDDICRADQPGSPLAGAVSRLTKSYRYRPHSGIARVAHAVHAGSYDALCAARDAHLEDATISHEPHGPGAPRGLLRLAQRGYAGLSRVKADDKLAALEHFRVLTAHRRGQSSSELLNPILARAVTGRSGGLDYPGRPIMITTNDYASTLYNGDVGVLHRERRDGALNAYFYDEARALRRIASARLPAHESVYAMTIHKSQGSEFEHVAVVLPERPSPILSRQLLYTAITRARTRVSIFASEAALQACLAPRPARTSGLSVRLRSDPR